MPVAAIGHGSSELSDIVADNAGLLEFLTPAPALSGTSRYTQMRGADRARASLIDSRTTPAPATGLITFGEPDGFDLPAFRASGFRSLLAVNGSLPVAAIPQGRGQILLQGGAVLDLSPSGPSLEDQISALLQSGAIAVAVLPFKTLSTDNMADRLVEIEALADRLVASTRTGEIILMQPIDYLLQASAGLSRWIAVAIQASPRSEAAAEALLSQLARRGISATLVAASDLLERLGRPDDCIMADPINTAAVVTRCLQPRETEVVAGNPADIVLHPPDADRQHTGVRNDGRLHIASETLADVFAQRSPVADAVLYLRAEDFPAQRNRDALIRRLQRLVADGGVHYRTLTDWADYIQAPDPLRARYLSARRRAATDPGRSPNMMTKAERAEFMADARAAWAYIDALTDGDTGHVIPTISLGAKRTSNVEITLWDSGSQINGSLSAARIGLISPDDCAERIGKLVANIPSLQIGGSRLPPAIFASDTLEALRPDFDVCDLGRFLLALDNAVWQGVMTQDAADAVISPWDIDAAVRDGRLHSFRSGRWEDITVSHCTDYIRPAFHRRGLMVENLYPEQGDASETDWQMAMLSRAAAAGPIGTEPFLLAQVEGASSPASKLISDVLFDAQLEWFEATDRFRFMSETPLDRPPWFVYQGLTLDVLGPDAWTINSVGRASSFQTDAARSSAEVIVAKAVYLWRAKSAHPYTEAAVQKIRRQCRREGKGFTVGVYAQPDAPMSDYFDINSNGIILSALASILDHGRTPHRP
ncbi:DUF3131 domain-containing protein [Thalassorhabdomicrobium marinisediminis]|uniref:DUF3131 domain-containing protein n=1 Tax=Thalassorhabdomicrobium marinisediminis TaxID=2170577 RepID=UPI0013048942|nr:DUF3131 domain-containing protein [Thalassorhabdomicrobium marinisediminis]